MSGPDSVVRRGLLLLLGPYVAPRDALEESLAAIWADVLNLDQVGVEDDFSDLGGDSFDATVVQMAIENEIRVRVPLSVLVETSNVAALAREIKRIQGS
jgi:acyl carrier protein